MSFGTRLEDSRLGVRCRIETCNAYGSFVVDAEAIFDLPAPVSLRHPDIVHDFTAQVGAPTVFPYLRAAVASLAAQLSVPASPLPLLRAGDITLTHDDEPVVEDAVSEPLMQGFSTAEDGGQEVIVEFFMDEETGAITRIGGEGQTPELDQLLDAWAEIPSRDELSVEWMVRRHGKASIRQAMEALREAHGDAAIETALAEIDEAVAHIEAEDAFDTLNTAVDKLIDVVAATKSTDDRGTSGGTERPGVSADLLEAAEDVCDGWKRFTTSIAS